MLTIKQSSLLQVEVYMIHTSIVFDHLQPMREYVSDEIRKALPILGKILAEMLEEQSDTKKKKKLRDEIGKLETVTEDIIKVIRSICLLFGEDFYMKEKPVKYYSKPNQLTFSTFLN